MSNEDKNLKTSFQVLTVALTLLVFGAAIWIAKEQMGERIREQVLARYAQELYAISLVHQVTMVESAEILFMDDTFDQLTVYGAVAELSGAMGHGFTRRTASFLSHPPRTSPKAACLPASWRWLAPLHRSAC